MGERNYWQSLDNAPLSRRRALTGSLVAATTVALAACGRSSANKPAKFIGLASSQPKTGGVLATPLKTDFFDFDASGSGKSVPNPSAYMLICDTLVGFQQGPDSPFDKNVLTPNLAERWEQPDPATYTFHLRKGIKFASLAPLNGRAFTSADIKWSYAYHSRTGTLAPAKLPPANFDYMFEGLQAVETPDDTTVVVKFSKPYAPFLNYNYTFALPIYPHEIYDQYGKFSDQLVGTGPYQLDSAQSQRGTRWVFKKNQITGRPENHISTRSVTSCYPTIPAATPPLRRGSCNCCAVSTISRRPPR